MNGKLILAAAGVGGALLLVACGSQSAPPQTARLTASHAGIVGTWIDTVTPNAPGGPFESTLVWTDSGAVIEATSKALTAPTADVSGGLGVWRANASSFSMTFQKYRFNSAGQYIGRTVIVETDTLQTENSYTGQATTTLYDASGNPLTSFTSTTRAVRMTVPDSNG